MDDTAVPTITELQEALDAAIKREYIARTLGILEEQVRNMDMIRQLRLEIAILQAKGE